MSVAAKLNSPSAEEELLTAQGEVLAGLGHQAIARLTPLIGAIDSPAARYWLAAAYQQTGDTAQYRQALKKAVLDHGARIARQAGVDLARMQADPAYAAAAGMQLYQRKMMGAASLCLGVAATKDANPAAMIQYGLSLQHQGRVEDAIDVMRAGVARAPHPAMHEFLLYVLFFAENGVHRHAEEVRRWAELYAPRLDPRKTRFANVRDANRKLRIGYVAPSFVGTQVRQYFMPSLEAHDREAFDIYLYPRDARAEGDLPATAIVSIGALSDEEACARIRQDRIDVLVDLWGHTDRGRLGVFARKAAPMQVAWINYVQSTGLKAIDYVIHADGMDAPGTEQLFAEKIWRLGPIMACFRPEARAAVTETPALRNGYVTFSCFNHPAKVSDPSVDAWSRILKARAGSKLVLKYDYYADPVLQEITRARFAARGVPPEQLEFRGRTSGAQYLAEFGDIDLALDPSPSPGGTTSSDAIASGVPVLLLRGDDFYARISIVHAAPLGLHELLTDSWDDYVQRALDLTADFDALNALRKRVRAQFDSSPARDEAGFTRTLEAAYRAMFQEWCDHG